MKPLPQRPWKISWPLFLSLSLLLLLLPGGLTPSPAEGELPAAFPALRLDGEPLRGDFNQNQQRPRLLLLLDPV